MQSMIQHQISIYYPHLIDFVLFLVDISIVKWLKIEEEEEKKTFWPAIKITNNHRAESSRPIRFSYCESFDKSDVSIKCSVCQAYCGTAMLSAAIITRGGKFRQAENEVCFYWLLIWCVMRLQFCMLFIQYEALTEWRNEFKPYMNIMNIRIYIYSVK